LTADIIELARQYGRYGYRRITALLRRAGWTVNKKRVERIWRCEGLKVPAKQPKRGHLWLNDGSCIRLRPERPNHVWSYDFVADRTHDGKAFRMLCVIDEFTRESLMIRVARKLKATDVIEALCELFVSRGYLRTYDRTMALSSLRLLFATGLLPSAPRPPTSNLGALGKTVIAKASTANCATSCSTAKFSIQ
jgi:transposase InsO family protein